MSTCYIIGAGQCGKLNINLCDGDYVICADGGLKYAEESGITPDFVIGDFDSCGRVPDYENIEVFPAEKDETDTHLAVKRAIESGFDTVHMFGMLGGRPDHSFANIQLLSYMCQCNVRGYIETDNYMLTAIKNSFLSVVGEKGKYISVFSYTEKSRGVNIKNLKYEVSDFVLESSVPLGVSNEFTEKDAYISVEDGMLIIMWEK